VTSCCTPGGYEVLFGARSARRNARQYAKKGLDATARRMVGFLVSRGVEEATVLEVGGGIGAIQLELLRAGAAHATNAEISSGYENVAQQLFRDAGLAAKVDRHIADFAVQPERFDPADIVVMHRVVCCYPDMPRLVGAAAAQTRRLLAMSFPRDGWWVRLGIRAANGFMWLRRWSFRAYVHAPSAIQSVAEAHDLHVVFEHRGWIWQSVVLERSAGPE
jgi:hypothetical protein